MNQFHLIFEYFTLKLTISKRCSHIVWSQISMKTKSSNKQNMKHFLIQCICESNTWCENSMELENVDEFNSERRYRWILKSSTSIKILRNRDIE